MAKLKIDPSRKLDKDFSKTPFTRRLGPRPDNETSTVEQIQNDGNQEVNVDNWEVMSNFDEGLRQALINWVNTTKEGRQVNNLTGSTRTKKIDFQFYGNPSKDIVGQGNIGEYSLVFKYTKRIIEPLATTNAQTLTQ